MKVWPYYVVCAASLLLGLTAGLADALGQSSQTAAASSPSNEAIRKALEAEVKAATPTHRLWLSNDRAIEGILVSETDTTLVLKEAFDPGNYISIPYKKSDIVRIELLPAIPITAADVGLKAEFPSLTFFKRPPYSVVTDESYFLVRHAMEALEKLHAQFRLFFSAWASPSTAAALPIQIVFFGNQEAFRRYAGTQAPHLESASGFYSPEKNRLVLFNQTAAGDLQAYHQNVARLRQQWLQAYPRGIPTEVEANLRRLESRGIEYTYLVIRHEGAHQLLRSYGIIPVRSTRPWLIEGLASFCETSTLGQPNPYRIQDLKRLQAENKLIPWQTLIEYQSERGFLGREVGWSEAAYAQSWLLAYSLMSGHKERFFRLLRDLRAEPESKTPPKPSMVRQLSEALGLAPSQLEAEWQALLNRIVAD